MRETPTEVPRPHPTDAALEALEHTRNASATTLAVVERLEGLLERAQDSPRLIIADLAAASPVFLDRQRQRESTRSVGLLNPSNVTVYIGGAWGSAMRSGPGGAVNTRVPSIAPNTMVVLPLPFVDLELAADPALLGANTAIVLAWRYRSVQAAFAGKLA